MRIPKQPAVRPTSPPKIESKAHFKPQQKALASLLILRGPVRFFDRKIINSPESFKVSYKHEESKTNSLDSRKKANTKEEREKLYRSCRVQSEGLKDPKRHNEDLNKENLEIKCAPEAIRLLSVYQPAETNMNAHELLHFCMAEKPAVPIYMATYNFGAYVEDFGIQEVTSEDESEANATVFEIKSVASVEIIDLRRSQSASEEISLIDSLESQGDNSSNYVIC